MTFRFRFESILHLRRQERDEAGGAVGQANEAIVRIDDQTAALEQKRLALRDRADRQRIGEISVDALLAGGRYDLQLQAEIKSLKQTRAQLTQELERRQQLLIEAEAEVKRFERLEEKERTEFRFRANRREQAEADEASTRRYAIQTRNGVK